MPEWEYFAVGDRLSDALIAFEKRLPGPVVAILAMAFYPVLGLLLPVSLNWSLTRLVAANLVGVYIAAIVVIAWMIGKQQAIKRTHLLEWTTDLRHLNAEEFEWLVGETYKRKGWSVTETGSQHQADGNIDLNLSRKGERMYVQCKRWSSREVPIEDIREFIGTLSVDGLDPQHGVFVTFSNLTPSAEEFARKARLTVLDAKGLYELMDEVRRGEPCPVCGKKMRLDHSAHGWWLRCVEAGCRGKLDLGINAGRAVEFLTESR